MKYKVLISEGEDGWYVVECPFIPGCVSQGKSLEEALENIKDAIQGCLDVLNEKIEIKGEVARQTGHTIMVKPGSEVTLSVPRHKELDRGTLRKLIKLAGLTWSLFIFIISLLVPTAHQEEPNVFVSPPLRMHPLPLPER